ncbi:MAG: hypothetical protein JNN29_11895, partial [Chitinophagaceae bacterium]|nr:hypothetical protein [Chitinophagaceae bacterium]
MKSKKLILLVAATTLISLVACKKGFLNVDPKGVLDENTLATEKGVNKLLLSA